MSAIRYKALDLLAAREHSRAELFGKLTARFSDEQGLVEQVLDQLVADQLLSDQRYVEAFIHSSIRRGRGPLRIRQELRQKGVDDGLIAEQIASAGVDWYELALTALTKKYQSAPDLSYKEKARRMRFLQSRGFSREQISACFSG